MAYLIGKPNSPIGKKVHLGPVGVSLEKALLWISEKYFEFNGKEISARKYLLTSWMKSNQEENWT